MKAPGSTQKITPFLWFDHQAEEAIHFYTSVFPNSEITQLKRWGEGLPFPDIQAGKVMQGSFVLDGVLFHAFDAGPMFKFNPSISFFAVYEEEDDINAIWEKLIDGGQAMMPLDSYHWSPRYGWLNDRYGVSWQLMQGKLEDVGQRISPLLFFTGAQRGRAEEAMQFYMSLFKDAVSDGIARYEPGEPGPTGMVKHAQFRVTGQTFMVMDGGVENTDMPFTEAISLMVSCEDQSEVDYFWEKLTANGGQEGQCGWLKDPFGVSWQIVPKAFDQMVNSGKEANARNVMQAMLQMKKFDIAKLEEAFHQPV